MLFRSMELYQAYGDMGDMMDLSEELIRHLANKVCKSLKVTWMNEEVDFEPSFKRASMTDLIKQYSGIDFVKISSTEEAIELAKKHGIEVEKHFDYGHIVNAFFEKYVEEHLIQPTFVMNHPLSISPLAKKCKDDPRFTERFELYVCRKEICNAFNELNDPIDQYNRFLNQVKEKESGNEEASEMDNDFIEALEYGLPPTAGIGFGIDRLIMMLTSNNSIREVILFPTMKPIPGE